MSHLRPTPAKLLILASVGLLICAVIEERRPACPVSQPVTPDVTSDPHGARYPDHLMVEQDAVILTGFTFSAPPLPDDPSLGGFSNSGSAEEGTKSSAKPGVPRPAEANVHVSSDEPTPAIFRLPPVETEEVDPQFISTSEKQEKCPTVKDARLTRLPPVHRPETLSPAKEPESGDSVQTEAETETAGPSIEVASAPIPEKPLPQISTEATASKLAKPQTKAQRKQGFERQPIIRLATKPATPIGADVVARTNEEVTDDTSGDGVSHPGQDLERPTPAGGQPVERRPTSIAAAPPARPSLVEAKRIPGPDPARVAVSRRAMKLVRKGQSLAVRNALYSARADFVQALRLIAQAEDELHGGLQHTTSIAAGLLALQEAKDFVPSGRGRWSDQFDVHVISAAHGTPVIREQIGDGKQQSKLTPWQAQQLYYAFAEKKLTEAAGHDAVASAALSSLGKLYVGRDGTSSEDNLVSSAQAMSYFKAALQVDSRNYMASNELGVLLARYGKLQDARQVLQHGVAIEKDSPPLWRNLAVVHQRLGEIDLERRARNEFNLASRRIESGQSGNETGGTIRWVDAKSFAGLTPPNERPRIAEQPPTTDEAATKKPAWRFW